MISKIVLKSDVWPGSEKCGFNPKFEDNGLKSGCYRISKLPPLSVNYVCPISQKTNHPIMIPKIVLKSVLWRGSESARYFCIFQLLCFLTPPYCTIYYTPYRQIKKTTIGKTGGSGLVSLPCSVFSCSDHHQKSSSSYRYPSSMPPKAPSPF